MWYDKIIKVMAFFQFIYLNSKQAIDIISEGVEDINIEQLELIHRNKTGTMLECPAVIGAIFGGAGEEEVEKLREYAKCIGLMFQVVDDILDATRSTSELGKTAGKDRATDKATYIKLLGLEKAKKMAEELNVEAREHLAGFDFMKATPLIALANYIACRQR